MKSKDGGTTRATGVPRAMQGTGASSGVRRGAVIAALSLATDLL
jgi:hypothetical protein